MAVLTSLVISTTLEVKLFESYLDDRRADAEAQQFEEEVRRSLATHEQSAKGDPVTADLKSREAAMATEIADLRATELRLVERQNELEDNVSAETRIINCGRKCEELKRVARVHETGSLTPHRDKLTARERDLQALRDSLSQQVATITTDARSTAVEREQRLIERQSQRSSDIISQIDRLHAVARENSTIMVMMLLVQLLLLVMEMMPLLAKLITKSAVEIRVQRQLELSQYKEEVNASIKREVLDRGRQASVDVEACMAAQDQMLREIHVAMSNPLWDSGVLDAEEIEALQFQLKEYLKQQRGVFRRDDPYRDPPPR